MQINISGKRVTLTEAMEAYAVKKCDRLTRFYDRVQEIDILVNKPNREFQVDVRARVDRHDPFVGTSTGEDFYACVDSVVDKLTRQLAEYKDRVRNRKHPS